MPAKVQINPKLYRFESMSFGTNFDYKKLIPLEGAFEELQDQLNLIKDDLNDNCQASTLKIPQMIKRNKSQ